MTAEKFAAREKEVKKKTEEERKDSIRRTMEFNREKKEIAEKIEAKKKFQFLRSIIERSGIGVDTASLINGDSEYSENSNESEVEQILMKIEEIEEIEQIDQILPKELRITQDEYLGARENDETRDKVLTKIDSALKHLYITFSPEGSLSFLFFQSVILSLQKNAVIVQENTVDIRRSIVGRQVVTPVLK